MGEGALGWKPGKAGLEEKRQAMLDPGALELGAHPIQSHTCWEELGPPGSQRWGALRVSPERASLPVVNTS